MAVMERLRLAVMQIGEKDVMAQDFVIFVSKNTHSNTKGKADI